ncbi:hypothetical protein GALL_366400 [mine drainage metagenome]|uniref:Uncharacterized protein n=1 Tax=mine drainage metagenome TaxID=410659 RepID=A0A1J5QVS9_9ZZZZ
MDNDKVDSKVSARFRVASYRATHRRIDYAPSPDALKLIEDIRARQPGWSYQEAIDALLRMAGKAITGNG